MSISLTINYGDGSKKVFSFDEGNSLFELFQLAKAKKAGLKTDWSTDRGPKEIFGYIIDGHGRASLKPGGGAWRLERNGKNFWPDHSEFETGSLNDGDSIVFTLKRE